MPEIANPHDRFFKEVFSRPDAAEDFVRHFLPEHVTAHFEPSTFRLRKGSFVDARLREHFSELLYQVDFKEEGTGFVYILFEHKSSPDPHTAWQILRYTMRIWEQEAKEATRSFSPVAPIIPVVLYHGTETWKIPRNFASLYRGLQPPPECCLDFSYYLVDLSAYSDFEIKLQTIPMVALLLMKHIYREDLPQRLPEIFALLTALGKDTALGFIETLLRYTGTAAPQKITGEHLRQAVEAALPKRGETQMNKAMLELISYYRPEFVEEVRTEVLRKVREEVRGEVREEVRGEVREEAIREGTASLTIRQLSRKLGPLDDATQERVRQLSLEKLEKLGEDLLDFTNPWELKEWLEREGSAQ